NRQTASISLGGLFHAKSLTSQTANLTVTGGGRAEINASQSVDLQTRAGGVMTYMEILETRKNGSLQVAELPTSSNPPTLAQSNMHGLTDPFDYVNVLYFSA